MESFYTGKYVSDCTDHRGWFIGTFMDGVRKTDAVEVKYFEGEIDNHSTKISKTFECTMVIAGEMSGEINGEPITLSAGSYVVIPPGVPNNLTIKSSEDLKGFTIKAPSDPGAKKIVG